MAAQSLLANVYHWVSNLYIYIYNLCKSLFICRLDELRHSNIVAALWLVPAVAQAVMWLAILLTPKRRWWSVTHNSSNVKYIMWYYGLHVSILRNHLQAHLCHRQGNTCFSIHSLVPQLTYRCHFHDTNVHKPSFKASAQIHDTLCANSWLWLGRLIVMSCTNVSVMDEDSAVYLCSYQFGVCGWGVVQ